MPTHLFYFNIVKKNDIKCEALEHYLNNRDVIIQKVMNDYQLKREMLSNYFEVF